MTEAEMIDCEGLTYLRWSMFDSPDEPGSGYKFMERETALALDNAVRIEKFTPTILMAYTSPMYANLMNLSSFDSHRIGKAVRIKCISTAKRSRMVTALAKHGVRRFGVSRKFGFLYFDTDKAKPDYFAVWDDYPPLEWS